ncbi:hypothetical protein [Streptomyces sp. NPDC102360]|uniref:hypothetical protein n=1 Tax=Streptomyces sp. NPDC102360 TaxID=3366160 RepID=UPI003807532C
MPCDSAGRARAQASRVLAHERRDRTASPQALAPQAPSRWPLAAGRWPLAEEVRHALAGIGLPGSDTSERDRAHGVVITDAQDGAVFVEWCTSRTLRETAATEQREPIAQGPQTSCTATAAAPCTRPSPQCCADTGTLKTDVHADQEVRVKRLPVPPPAPEPAPADPPLSLGEVLSGAPSPKRGFLTDQDESDSQ